MKDQPETTEKQSEAAPTKTTPILLILYRLEDGILVGLLLLLIGLAAWQIFLRNLFESSIFWGDILTRILVLWIGLVGAMVASRQNKHINIDILSRYLSERSKQVVNGITGLFTGVICSVIAWHSFRFVQMEFESKSVAFAQIPSWVCEAVIPFAFSVIALRYFILSLMNFIHTLYTRRFVF